MAKFKSYFVEEKDGSFTSLTYILIYIVLAHVCFWKYLVPGNFAFGTDTVNQSYPINNMGMNEIFKNHSMPLWNPYIFSGMPLLASFSFDVFYPGSWIYFFFSQNFATGYLYILHFILMGCFLFAFLRHLGLSRRASFVGGLIFMFAPHLVTLVYPGHGGKIYTMTWLPLALLFLDRALDKEPLFNLTVMGLMVGLMFYGGHIQILFYCGITLLMFLLMRLGDGIRGRGWKWALKGAAGFVYAFGLGTFLYAAVLIPAFQYKKFTERGQGGTLTAASSYEFATSFSMPPEDMLYTIMHDPFGWGKNYGPTIPTIKPTAPWLARLLGTTTDRIFYRGRMGLKLSLDYFGVLGVMLGLIGAFFRRSRYTWFFLGMGMLTGFLALGGFNPFYHFIYKHIPGFSIFRIPYAIMILSPICGSVLAAHGMQYLLDYEAKTKARDKAKGKGKSKVKRDGLFYFITGGAFVLAFVLGTAFYWKSDMFGAVNRWLDHEWVREMLWGQYDDAPERLSYFIKNMFIFSGMLAISIALLSVYRKGWLNKKYLTLIVSIIILVDLWPVDWSMIRTIPVSALNSVFYKETPQIKVLEADKNGPFRVFSLVTQNELLVRGIESLTGYHAAPLSYYMNTVNSITFDNPILDLLNARYLLLPKQPEYDFSAISDPTGRKMMMDKYELLDNSNVYFYKRKMALPRAWLVDSIIKVDDPEQALGIISDPRFPPFASAVVSGSRPLDFYISPSANLSGQKTQVTKYTPDEMDIDVFAPANSFLVASEVWYPGWKAYVDGIRTHIYRSDYVLRGIPVSKGSHKLVLKFSPGTYHLGVALTLLALAFITSVFVWRYRFSRR
ncbi:MAG: YfhO family protein [Nitrospirota bacterium]